MKPLFGLETEYGLVAPGPAPTAQSNLTAASTVLSAIGRLVPAMPAHGQAGIFLANGARAYVDAHHLEIATPEVTDPWEAVRYTLAGDRLVEQAIEQRFGAGAGARPRAFKGNVDYIGRETWGSHESILHRCRPREVSVQLLPHLVSRIAFTGAGGFDPFSAGVTFAVSPRALFMEYPESSSSMESRGIVHTRDEPLARGACRRLHLICGESLCSERAMWLRSATTVLVVAMIDGGLEPAAGITLANPVAALHGFSRDPYCRVEARLAGGGAATALEMQRRILSLAEANAEAPFMPEWTRAACREWRAVLDDLAGGPGAISRSLDWGIKRALFERVLARHGATWDTAAAWTDALETIWGALRQEYPLFGAADPERLLDPAVAAQARAAGARAICRQRGLEWSALPRLLAMRRALFECDLRFGELGALGLFTDLDRSHVLAHRVDGIGDVPAAVLHPPATTRARARGEAVRELSASRFGYTCDWDRISSVRANRWLDLSHPLDTTARWQTLQEPPAGPLLGPRERELGGPLEPDVEPVSLPDGSVPEWVLHHRRELARGCFLSGNYGGAERLLENLLAEGFEVASTHCHLARLYLKTGAAERMRRHVDQAWDARGDAPAYIVARAIWFQILVATLDARDARPWIVEMKAHLDRTDQPSEWSMEPVLDDLHDILQPPALGMMLSLYRVLTGADPVSVLEECEWWTGVGQSRAPA